MWPSNESIPPYDFAAALMFSPQQRLDRCVAVARERLTTIDVGDNLPAIPPCGASEEELTELARRLHVPVPEEYRLLLSNWRYLYFGPGLAIWGLSYHGVTVGWPWVQAMPDRPGEYLIIGDYWRYSDGDQLMLDLTDPEAAAFIYLHESGSSVEYFAPSLSLAVWRMIHED